MNNELTNKTRIFFGVVICLIYVMVISSLIFLPIPEANRGIIDVMYGSITTIMGMVFTYYFGSSEGSSKKTDALVNNQSHVNMTQIENQNITESKE